MLTTKKKKKNKIIKIWTWSWNSMSWPHDGHVMVFLISSVLGGSRTFVFSLEVAVIIWRALSSSESLHHVISLFLLSCPSQNSIFPLVSSTSSEYRDHSSYQHTDIEKLKKIEKKKKNPKKKQNNLLKKVVVKLGCHFLKHVFLDLLLDMRKGI